ncbi:LysR family transcriptional regulator [Alteromonas flava]|uniref:LysR family transcriptional regulator n=1 Tax=Alteromonas flava TaxID=2048003 RepID=UPI000C294B96|nr:LysR family transcriptional regulator [Alteromonas flava]
MPNPINLDALMVLKTIQEKGSFAAAAEALFKVPSALTYTVSKLEQELGVALFDRSGHRAVLTPAGQLVLEEGLQLLQAANRLAEKVKELETGWEPRLTIALDSLLPCTPLLGLIEDFCQLQKPVNIQIIEEVLGGSWDALYTQRADIAIGVSGEVASGLYDIAQIGEVEWVFAVAPHHPLARLSEPVAANQVQEFPAVVVSDSSRTLAQRSSGLFAARQTISVSSLAHKIAAQVQGVGVGFLPLHAIKQELKEQKLVIKYTDIPRPPIPIYLAKAKTTQGKAATWFYEHATEQNWLN